MKYPITLKGEIGNQLGHIALGFIIAHSYLAYESIYVIIVFLAMSGAYREWKQERRKKEQPWWVHIIDTATIALGGLLWYGIKTYFNINVDLL